MFAFYFMFPFSFFSKHKNKFNRKVFHDGVNSENRFSEFPYFINRLQKAYHKYLSVVYTMKP